MSGPQETLVSLGPVILIVALSLVKDQFFCSPNSRGHTSSPPGVFLKPLKADLKLGKESIPSLTALLGGVQLTLSFQSVNVLLAFS